MPIVDEIDPWRLVAVGSSCTTFVTTSCSLLSSAARGGGMLPMQQQRQLLMHAHAVQRMCGASMASQRSYCTAVSDTHCTAVSDTVQPCDWWVGFGGDASCVP